MGRPRTFDEGAALDRAMDVFWRQGYQATSTQDLMAAMGIGRGSFYNAFGSKRETYLRTLDRYLDLLDESGPYKALFELEPGADALQSMLESYLASVTRDDGTHGCYFVHAAKEHRGADPEVQQAIRRGVARMRKILTGHMEAARRQGALPAHFDPGRAALLVMAVAWGAHVLLEAGVKESEARAASGLVLDMGPKPEIA